jgi:hypothetical protein
MFAVDPIRESTSTRGGLGPQVLIIARSMRDAAALWQMIDVSREGDSTSQPWADFVILGHELSRGRDSAVNVGTIKGPVRFERVLTDFVLEQSADSRVLKGYDFALVPDDLRLSTAEWDHINTGLLTRIDVAEAHFHENPTSNTVKQLDSRLILAPLPRPGDAWERVSVAIAVALGASTVVLAAFFIYSFISGAGR